MRRKSTSTSGLTLLFFLVLAPITSAATVEINYTHRGWYDITGFHNTFNDNYAVGDDRGGGLCGPTTCFNDYRNFFVFDLSGVTQQISSAKLALNVPLAAYESSDSSENYELHDIITPIAVLIDGTGGLAAHADLGSGVVYGSRTMTAADMASVVEITLNSSAVSALNSTHRLFGIGGSLTTLDDLANNEYTFGVTNFEKISQLRLTLVPEPSTLLLLAISATSLLGYRKAKPVRRHR
jgi:hypothetical protein